MGGKRVFEFAKEFKISSKEMIEELKKLGIEVSSHMAVLDEKAIGRLRGRFHKQEEKVSDGFKGVKSSAKTILIKKKPKIEAGEEVKPVVPVSSESAETNISPGIASKAEEIPGVNTQGRTQKEAKENLKEALQLILEANRTLALGRAIETKRESFRIAVPA